MEYNLQKSINPSLNDLLLPAHVKTPLTAFPAKDYVTPGIGQITSLYSFIVPLYSEISPYNIKKQVEVIQGDQIGSGIDPSTTDPSTSTSSSDPPLINEAQKNDETKLYLEGNDRKRKLLDDGIEQSFLHPKVFKTKTVNLEQKSQAVVPDRSEKTSKKTSVPAAKNMSINHKFKFAD